MSLKKFFEQHLQLHTLRIELTTGRVLIYQIDGQRKAELEEWMRNPVDELESLTSSFLSFYSDYDRFVFIRISAVSRIIFLWDPAFTVADPTGYTDPFNILSPAETETETVTNEDPESNEVPEWLKDLDLNEASKNDTPGIADTDLFFENESDEGASPDIPDAIVLTANGEPFLYYDLDEEADYLQILNSGNLNSLALDGRYLSFPDADDEQNYIPVENVICLDVSRRLVFKDNTWEEMERKRSIDNNTN